MAIRLPQPDSLPARQPELLVAAALHLMSHYSAHAANGGSCIKLAAIIERHLKALAGHAELAPVLRATCGQLSEQWAQVVEQSLPRPRSSLLGRLVGGARH